MKTFPIIPALLLVTLSSAALPAFANDTAMKRCQQINWKAGMVIPIQAQMYKNTHITLPENALDVLWAPKELWETDFIHNHIFVKPLNSQPQGDSTTVTAIGVSGNSYEFDVQRVSRLNVQCVTIVADGDLIHRKNWEQKDDHMQQAVIQLLQQQLAKSNSTKAQVSVEAQREIDEALKTYRAGISANYDWSKGDGWFADSSVESVYDDGRFTYIRLKTDSHGIMSVLAEIDGKQEILQKVYDAERHEYRIAGIYPKFILRAGNSEVVVTRRS